MSDDLSTPSPLETLYAELPRIECRGLCAESCGPVPMTGGEALRAQARSGRPPGRRRGTMDCTYLTLEGRCSIYEARPLICRLYGVDPAMPCRFGCQPERWLSREESADLIRRVFALDDSSTVVSVVRSLREV